MDLKSILAPGKLLYNVNDAMHPTLIELINKNKITPYTYYQGKWRKRNSKIIKKKKTIRYHEI